MTTANRRRWYNRVAYGTLALGYAVALLVAIDQGQDARTKAIRESERRDEAIEREQTRADDAICRIAASNRTQSIVLLVAFQEAVRARPNENPVRQAENVALVDRLLADARAPFPQPCTRYTPSL